MKLTNKEKIRVENWFGDYFCKTILPICQILGYKVFVNLDLNSGDNKTFSISVNHPYKGIDLTIHKQATEWLKHKRYDLIRFAMLHEAFHVIHWKFRMYAEERFMEEKILDDLEEEMADQFAMIIDHFHKELNKKKS